MPLETHAPDALPVKATEMIAQLVKSVICFFACSHLIGMCFFKSYPVLLESFPHETPLYFSPFMPSILIEAFQDSRGTAHQRSRRCIGCRKEGSRELLLRTKARLSRVCCPEPGTRLRGHD